MKDFIVVACVIIICIIESVNYLVSLFGVIFKTMWLICQVISRNLDKLVAIFTNKQKEANSIPDK